MFKRMRVNERTSVSERFRIVLRGALELCELRICWVHRARSFVSFTTEPSSHLAQGCQLAIRPLCARDFGVARPSNNCIDGERERERCIQTPANYTSFTSPPLPCCLSTLDRNAVKCT